MPGVLQSRIYDIMTRDKPSNDNTENTENSTNTEEESTKRYEFFKNAEEYLAYLKTQNEEKSDVKNHDMKIFGCPHKFLASADIPISENNNIGYAFYTHIYNERPICTLIPGKMNYLPDFSKHEAEIFNSLSGSVEDGNAKRVLEDLVKDKEGFANFINRNDGTRYYDFDQDYATYINYVNVLCRTAAVFLGIGDKKGPDGKTAYSKYNWAHYQSYIDYESNIPNEQILSVANDIVKQAIKDCTEGYRNYTNFYIDPNTSVNESITNTTQKSQLEGLFDTVESTVKEAAMFNDTLGGSFLSDLVETAGETVLALANTVSVGMLGHLLGSSGQSVINGANLIFPEIWTDSEYDKSFNIQVNLISPYGTREAIYLNIFVPTIHLLCFALPRQASANTFTAPFLVRGYAQGWFSIDMGMVESITIDKGPEQSWSVDGFPTQVKVTLSIKELYTQLMMAPSTRPAMFFSNQGMLDYLGCMCGIDLSQPSIGLKVDILLNLLSNYVRDIPNNAYNHATQAVRNFLGNVFSY